MTAGAPLAVSPSADPGPDHRCAASLRADIARIGTVTVFSLVGDVDLATAGVFAPALIDLASVARAGDRIVLDLTRVAFLAALGLAAIGRAHIRTHHRGAVLLLVAERTGPVAAALRFLPDDLGPNTYPTLTEALAARAP